MAGAGADSPGILQEKSMIPVCVSVNCLLNPYKRGSFIMRSPVQRKDVTKADGYKRL